ncbi:MAG: winged helix-turn-helix domain-containing protein [Sphingomonadales bacterium]
MPSNNKAPSSDQGGQAFCLKDWQVHPGLNELSGKAGKVRLEPMLMELLCLLAGQAPEPVSKERIIEEIWDGRIVGDDVLSQAVSKLRRALGDQSNTPEYIETVWKKGYRCIVLPGPLAEGPKRLMPTRAIAVGVMIGLSVLLLAVVYWPRAPEPAKVDSLFDLASRSLVTSLPGRERDPAVSPDGRLIAFSSRDSETRSFNLFVTPLTGAGAIRLTNVTQNDLSPAWSPDGGRIAFIRKGEGTCDIYSISALGGGLEKVTGCEGNGFADLAWSRDGRWLALNSRPGPADPFAIKLIEIEGGKTVFLTRPAASDWGDFDPAFSPDSKTVAFVRAYSEASQDVFVVPLEGGKERQITRYRHNVFGVAWLPGNEGLLIAANRFGLYDLWRANGDAEMSLVLGGLFEPVNPSLSADGSILALEARQQEVNIWAAEMNEQGAFETARPLISSTRLDLHPAPSPDGKWIAYSSSRSGSFEIWLAKADGTDARMLTDLGAHFAGTPDWSSGSDRIVFDARIDQQSSIYMIDIVGDNPRRLTGERAGDLSPVWSGDSERIYFSSDRDDSWNIHSLTLEDMNIRKITTAGGLRAMEGPAGKFLYVALPRGGGIERLDLESGAKSLVLAELDEGDWANWQVMGSDLYFVERRRDGDYFQRLELETGRMETVLKAATRVPRGDKAFGVTMDGRRLLYSSLDRQESDIVYLRRAGK